MLFKPIPSAFVCFISLLLFQTACSSPQTKIETEQQHFNLPAIHHVSDVDSIRLFECDYLIESMFLFYGKFKFSDELKLEGHPHRIYEYKNEYVREYVRPEPNDTIQTDGFQIFVDYNTNITLNVSSDTNGNTFFPIYVVNENTRTKMFVAKDSYVFGIQEAINDTRYHSWLPIECKPLFFCGNGYCGLMVQPGEFVMFLAPKYEGEEKHDMRIRLQIGENLYFSPTYKGTMNPKQFEIKGADLKYQLNEQPANTIQWRFYGAFPLGYEAR